MGRVFRVGLRWRRQTTPRRATEEENGRNNPQGMASFDIIPWMAWSEDHLAVPFVAVAAYLALLAGGKAAMQKREAFSLRVPLIAWNLTLCVFSAAGFVVAAPALASDLQSIGLQGVLCAVPAAERFRHGWVGVVAISFMFSKIPELGDTLFLVLRKKGTGFLHVYHHSTVLLYCWLAFAWRTNTGFIFLSMNLFGA